MTHIIKVIVTLLVAVTGASNDGGISTPKDEVLPPTSLKTADTVMFEQLTTDEPLVIEPKEVKEVEIVEEVIEEVEEVVKEVVKPPTHGMEVCYNGVNFASYMDYRAITRGSQLELQNKSATNELGLRTYNGMVLIAMANRYGNVGDTIQVTFEDNHTEWFVIGDIKGGTDCTHGNSLIEVIVDTNLVASEVRRDGKVHQYSKRVIKLNR